MQKKHYRTYDTPERFGQDVYPFRCTAPDAGIILEWLIARLMLPMFATGPLVFLVLVAGLILMPEAWAGRFVAAGLLLSLVLGNVVIQSHHTASYYDKRTRRFCIERTWLRWTRTWCWERAMFAGVAPARPRAAGAHGGRSYQLHTRKPGLYVPRFMTSWDDASHDAVLHRLAGYAQLPVLAEHDGKGLSDLRYNEWMLQRPSTTAPTEAESASAPSDTTRLPPLVRQARSPSGGFTLAFVFLLSLFSLLLAGKFVDQEITVASDMAAIESGRLAGKPYVVSGIHHVIRRETLGQRAGSSATSTRTFVSKVAALKSADGSRIVYPWSEGLGIGTRVMGYVIDGRFRVAGHPPPTVGVTGILLTLLLPGLAIFYQARYWLRNRTRR